MRYIRGQLLGCRLFDMLSYEKVSTWYPALAVPSLCLNPAFWYPAFGERGFSCLALCFALFGVRRHALLPHAVAASRWRATNGYAGIGALQAGHNSCTALRVDRRFFCDQQNAAKKCAHMANTYTVRIGSARGVDCRCFCCFARKMVFRPTRWGPLLGLF